VKKLTKKKGDLKPQNQKRKNAMKRGKKANWGDCFLGRKGNGNEEKSKKKDPSGRPIKRFTKKEGGKESKTNKGGGKKGSKKSTRGKKEKKTNNLSIKKGNSHGTAGQRTV